MDVLEKYVTTAALAGGYGVIGIVGARYHYQTASEGDPFSYAFGWIGSATILLLAVSVSLWAFLRTEKELRVWTGDSGFRSFASFLILLSLLTATGASWYHVLAIFDTPPQ